MKASLFITLILFKSLLIDPTNAAFVGKSEWDCINNVLFNKQVMETLLGMPEEACADGLPLPPGLFDHVQLISAEDAFEEQLLETPLTPETLGLSASAAQHFIDRQHNAALEEFSLDVDFDRRPPTQIHMGDIVTLDIGAQPQIVKETVEREEEQPLELSGFDLNLSLSGLDSDLNNGNRKRAVDTEEQNQLQFEDVNDNIKVVARQSEDEPDNVEEQQGLFEEKLSSSRLENERDPDLLSPEVMQEPGLAPQTLPTQKQVDLGLELEDEEEQDQPDTKVIVNQTEKELSQSGVKMNIVGQETTNIETVDHEAQEELLGSGLGDSLSLSGFDFEELDRPRRKSDDSFTDGNELKFADQEENYTVKARDPSEILAAVTEPITSTIQPSTGQEEHQETIQNEIDQVTPSLIASMVKDVPAIVQSGLEESTPGVKTTELKKSDALAHSVAKLNVKIENDDELITSIHEAPLETSHLNDPDVLDLGSSDILDPKNEKKLDSSEAELKFTDVDKNNVLKKSKVGSEIEEPIAGVISSIVEQQPGLATSTTLKDDIVDLHIKTNTEPNIEVVETEETTDDDIPDLSLSLSTSLPAFQGDHNRKLDTSEIAATFENVEHNIVPKVGPADDIEIEEPALQKSTHDEQPPISLIESIPAFELDELFKSTPATVTLPTIDKQPGLTTSTLLKEGEIDLHIIKHEDPQVEVIETEEIIPDLSLSLSNSLPAFQGDHNRKLDTSEIAATFENVEHNIVPKIGPTEDIELEEPALQKSTHEEKPQISLIESIPADKLDELLKSEPLIVTHQEIDLPTGLTTSAVIKDDVVELHIQTNEDPQVNVIETEEIIPDLSLSLSDSLPAFQGKNNRKLDTSEIAATFENVEHNIVPKTGSTGDIELEEPALQKSTHDEKPPISLIESIPAYELDELFKDEPLTITQQTIDQPTGLTTSAVIKDDVVELHIQTKEDPQVNVIETEEIIPDLSLSLSDSLPAFQGDNNRKLDTSEIAATFENVEHNIVPKGGPEGETEDEKQIELIKSTLEDSEPVITVSQIPFQPTQEPIDLTIGEPVDLSVILRDSELPAHTSEIGTPSHSQGPRDDIHLRVSKIEKSHVSVTDSIIETDPNLDLSDLELSKSEFKGPRPTDESQPGVQFEEIEGNVVPVETEESEIDPGKQTKKIEKTIEKPKGPGANTDPKKQDETIPDLAISLDEIEKPNIENSKVPDLEKSKPSVIVDLTTSEDKKTDIHTPVRPGPFDVVITDLEDSTPSDRDRPKDIEESEKPKFVDRETNIKPVNPPQKDNDDVEFFEIKGFKPSINDSTSSIVSSEKPKPRDWDFDPSELLTSSELKAFDSSESSVSSLSSKSSDSSLSSKSIKSDLSYSSSEIAGSQVKPPVDDIIPTEPSKITIISELKDFKPEFSEPAKPIVPSEEEKPSGIDFSLPEHSISPEVPNKPFDNKRFIEKPAGPLTFSNLSQPDENRPKTGHGKTYFVAQPVNRVLPSVLQQTREVVAQRTFRAFPLLHKCVQRALEQCTPNAEKLKKVCSDAHGRDCELHNFIVRLKCADNEDLINNACYSKCPEGFADYKLFCLKPAYVRRQVWRFNGQPLAKDEKLYGDSLVVEDCKKFGKLMRDVGPDLCGSPCPEGFLDRGTFCQKPARFQNQQLYVFTKRTANKSE